MLLVISESFFRIKLPMDFFAIFSLCMLIMLHQWFLINCKVSIFSFEGMVEKWRNEDRREWVCWKENKAKKKNSFVRNLTASSTEITVTSSEPNSKPSEPPFQKYQKVTAGSPYRPFKFSPLPSLNFDLKFIHPLYVWFWAHFIFFSSSTHELS